MLTIIFFLRGRISELQNFILSVVPFNLAHRDLEWYWQFGA